MNAAIEATNPNGASESVYHTEGTAMDTIPTSQACDRGIRFDGICDKGGYSQGMERQVHRV